MLAFSDIDDRGAALALAPSADTNAVVAMGIFAAYVAMVFLASSPRCGSEKSFCSLLWRKHRMRRHRYGRRMGNRDAKVSMPAPLPKRPRRRRKMGRNNVEARTFSASKKQQVHVSQEKLKILSTRVTSKKDFIEQMASDARLRSSGMPLIDLARMQDWDSLVIRCATHPRETRHRDADRLLPLHWACSGGPPAYAIRALLEACPGSARRVDSEDSTALHFSCHYGGSVEVVKLLLDEHPEAIRHKDAYGRTPLYHAVDKGAGIDVLEVLLQDATVATMPCVPKKQKIPPRTRKSMSSEVAVPRTPLRVAWMKVLSSSPSSRRSGKKWDKAMLLLKAAYSEADKNDYHSSNEFHMLHAALTLYDHLPPQVLDLALDVCPEQIRKLDAKGRVPLAVASSTRYRDETTSYQVIDSLLKLDPGAARIADNDGRLPVALALESGKTWEGGVRRLLETDPDTAFSQDSATALFPFMLAATMESAVHAAVRNSDASMDQYDLIEDLPSRRDTVPTISKASNEASNPIPIPSTNAEQVQSCGITKEQAADIEHVNTIYELLLRFPDSVTTYSTR